MEVSQVMGVPPVIQSWTWSTTSFETGNPMVTTGGPPKWIVYFMDNPNLKSMITGVPP